jgi:hypothetical protein
MVIFYASNILFNKETFWCEMIFSDEDSCHLLDYDTV